MQWEVQVLMSLDNKNNHKDPHLETLETGTINAVPPPEHLRLHGFDALVCHELSVDIPKKILKMTN
jgi:hypothetical protein